MPLRSKNLKTLRIQNLSLQQIDVPSPKKTWCVGLRHLPESIPAARQASLGILQIMQPLVVAFIPASERQTEAARRYKLVAGRRTLQLLLEQFPRDHKTWALCVSDANLPDESDLEVLDTLLFKLLCRPDADDLAMIASALKEDDEFRAIADKYVDVSDDAAIGSLVGMSRTGLHRSATKYRERISRTHVHREPISIDPLPTPESQPDQPPPEPTPPVAQE